MTFAAVEKRQSSSSASTRPMKIQLMRAPEKQSREEETSFTMSLSEPRSSSFCKVLRSTKIEIRKQKHSQKGVDFDQGNQTIASLIHPIKIRNYISFRMSQKKHIKMDFLRVKRERGRTNERHCEVLNTPVVMAHAFEAT